MRAHCKPSDAHAPQVARRLRRTCWAGTGLALLPIACLAAQPSASPPMGVWTSKGQLGFLGSQGNTNAQSLNAALDAGIVAAPWAHAVHLDYLYGRSAGIVAAERWDGRWQSKYSYSKQMFAFGELNYQHDMFSGFQYQASATAGVGYQVLDTSAAKLSAQVGAGYQRLRPEELVKDAAGAVIYRIPRPARGGAVLTGGIDYAQTLTSTTTLTDTLRAQTGASNTQITNALALAVKMSDRLAVGLGYTLQRNSQPPLGLKKLDSTETVNLVYSF